MNDQTRTGGCQCGAIRYTLTGKAKRLNLCYCRDCQMQSGSAFGMSLVIDPACFQLQRGALKTFQAIADSGRPKTCAFCPDCGVRIYNATSALMSIKAGTLDDRSGLQPDAQHWTSRKQPWLALSDDIPNFEQ